MVKTECSTVELYYSAIKLRYHFWKNEFYYFLGSPVIHEVQGALVVLILFNFKTTSCKCRNVRIRLWAGALVVRLCEKVPALF